MKIPYKHIIQFIKCKPSIDEISEKFFQLGHEHEINEGIFEMELTPNRGDCISVEGLLRELSIFYDVTIDNEVFLEDLTPLDLDFQNNAPSACPRISFLRIDIQGDTDAYKGLLKDYFNDLNTKKINFFTDISNYISYETGQPTHCYDATKIKGPLSLEAVEGRFNFESVLGHKIELEDKNLVFLQDEKIINLAGLMGGRDTSCSKNTTSVLVECAYFVPDSIIGKSVKYNLKTDAAHKFERGVDPLCHERVLRRFAKVVRDHANIVNIQIFSEEYEQYIPIEIPLDNKIINKILGISLNNLEFQRYLSKLGFETKNNFIIAPSFRSDINSQNDIAEEIARLIGYNNIKSQQFKIPLSKKAIISSHIQELNIRNILKDNGFFEVINYPFVKSDCEDSIKVDNPLDSNRKSLRVSLKNSLLENLLYNERRQKDSIKFFEISDVYYHESDHEIKYKKLLGIICSGRVGKNYLNFSKKIDKKYLEDILSKFESVNIINSESIPRHGLNSKFKNDIIFFEIELNSEAIQLTNNKLKTKKLGDYNFIKYEPISQFPSSTRDLSFSIKDEKKYYELQEFLINYHNDLVKDIFIFDFFHNVKNNEIKIGFRFIFQSNVSTITESQINKIMNKIIDDALSMDKVEIPGLKR